MPTDDTPRVRCRGCTHAPANVPGRCPATGRAIRSLGAHRSCDAFKPRVSPARSAHAALRAAGLLGHVAVLADVDGRRVGLRVRAEADRETASRVLLTVDRTMRPAA